MKNNIFLILFYFHFSLGVSLADVLQEPKMLRQRMAGKDLDLACITSTKGTELHKQREWFIIVASSLSNQSDNLECLAFQIMAPACTYSRR